MTHIEQIGETYSIKNDTRTNSFLCEAIRGDEYNNKNLGREFG